MNNIPVVFASDNNYIVPTIVAITSILENKKQNTFYEFYILDNGISDANKVKFIWKQYQNGYSLQFLPIDLKELGEKKCYGNWVPAIYAKYFIPDLLPEHKKCLWLDSDTIILSDLTELYNTELNNNYLGAVKSTLTNYYVAAEKHLFLSRDKYNLKCINVGVLVLNLEALRMIGGGSFFQKETFDTIARFPQGSLVTEQDMFNKLLVDNIVYLPLKYNFYVINVYSIYEHHYYPFYFSRSIIEEAFLNPVVIHYALPEKPWIYSNAKSVYVNFYKFTAAIWHNYFKKSPISDQKLKKKRLGLLLVFFYHIKLFLKQNSFLRKINRYITKKKINSPIHDFFD
jgi:lipopolysaccharide biosynthesis glycosyltransferase